MKLTNLKQKNKDGKENFENLEKANQKLDDHNKKLNDENLKLDTEIVMVVQRVEVNHLLQEVDIEDLKLLANNTNSMNSQFMEMMVKWDQIKRRAVEKVSTLEKESAK